MRVPKVGLAVIMFQVGSSRYGRIQTLFMSLSLPHYPIKVYESRKATNLNT